MQTLAAMATFAVRVNPLKNNAGTAADDADANPPPRGLGEGQAAGILDHARCRTIRTIKIRMTAPMNPAIK